MVLMKLSNTTQLTASSLDKCNCETQQKQSLSIPGLSTLEQMLVKDSEGASFSNI